MKNSSKYERQYFMPSEVTYDWVKKEYIQAPPVDVYKRQHLRLTIVINTQGVVYNA